MGFAPAPQVERVVSYSLQHGVRNFAALVPGNTYGALVGQVFQMAVARGGGTVVDIETYDPARHDSDAHVKALAVKRPQIEALFLPEGGGDLTVISNELANAGFDSHAVHVLGTGLWDMPGLGRQTGFVVGGWYAAPDPAVRRNFISNYMGTYGQEPPRLATLAYDATALAAVLAKRGSAFDTAALTNPNGFAGLDGIFRLTQQGLVERGLAVNEVTVEGAKVIEGGPTTFAVTSN